MGQEPGTEGQYCRIPLTRGAQRSEKSYRQKVEQCCQERAGREAQGAVVSWGQALWELCGRTVAMAAQQCGWALATSCTLNTVKMACFGLCVFHHNSK